MLVLALDTTTRQGSVALTRDGGIVAVYAGDAAITHGARLPGDLMRLFDAHDLRVADVDLFAVASGPGSLTGLRIGIATMQGFALANSKPLAGISALDAIVDAVSSPASAPHSGATARLAEARRPVTADEQRRQLSALSSGGEVAAWMDAGRGQVFSARYKDGDVVEPALAGRPAEILARWAQEGTHPALFAGDGALACRDLIRAAVPDAEIVDPVPPLAPSIARLAERLLHQYGPSAPDAIRPIYVRRSDVELARDRAAVAAAAPAVLRRDERP
jgi:tRNA threonylcarbamoyladenosine biosynthesis protein TsaB